MLFMKLAVVHATFLFLSTAFDNSSTATLNGNIW